jgi:hypothetical protein
LENDVVSLPDAAAAAPQPLMVPLTLIHGADSKGAGFFLFFLIQLILLLTLHSIYSNHYPRK